MLRLLAGTQISSFFAVPAVSLSTSVHDTESCTPSLQACTTEAAQIVDYKVRLHTVQVTWRAFLHVLVDTFVLVPGSKSCTQAHCLELDSRQVQQYKAQVDHSTATFPVLQAQTTHVAVVSMRQAVATVSSCIQDEFVPNAGG